MIAFSHLLILQWILPFLYLLLQRHLAIIDIARSFVLDEGEMMVHTQSLVSTFRTFEGRIKDLEGGFLCYLFHF